MQSKRVTGSRTTSCVATRISRIVALGGIAALSVGACGHGTEPSSSPDTTITITSAGVSPKSLTVAIGTQVTFVNNDVRDHNMYSDPHPVHTDCPPINDVGYLPRGQSKQTGNLIVARTCGFHDHELFDDKSLQGTITVK